MVAARCWRCGGWEEASDWGVEVGFEDWRTLESAEGGGNEGVVVLTDGAMVVLCFLHS